ncbi:T9SS type B sorting domain-containing protein, partial [Salinimicrobium sp. CAU 1759]
NEDQVRAVFENLLDDDATAGGEFSPTMAEITAQFNSGDGIGTYSTTYIIEQGTACEDSAILSVTVIGDNAAGEDNTDTEICLDTENVSSSEVEEIFMALITGGITGGTFNPSIEALKTQLNNSDGAGTFSTTYTVGKGTGCEDSAELAVTITGSEGNAGEDNTATVFCRSELAETANEDQVRAVFENLLDDDATAGGNFAPTMAEITAQFNSGDGIGTYSTTYTVGQGTACEDSAILSVTVIGDGAAGEDNTNTEICLDTTSITSSEVEDIFSNLITGVAGGTFNPSITELTTQINNSDGAGTFSTTYTIGKGTGCEDSAELAVTITGSEGNAGEDNTATVFCRSELAETANEDQVRAVFENLLDDDATAGGNFVPSFAEITAQFNSGDGIGTYSTTYTVGQGTTCEDSAVLSVTVIGDGAAGEDNTNTEICLDTISITSSEVEDIFSNLVTGVAGGTFNPSITELTTQINNSDGAGTFSTTYTVGKGTGCEESAQLTIIINGQNSANAGADNSRTVCNSEVRNLSNTGVRNLYLNLLEAGVDRTGTFNPTIQQIIDQYNFQSNFGDFTTTYTVGTGDCQDSAELTVTVLENPNPGQSTTVNLEEGTTETVNLFAELGEDAEAGGTWTFDGEEVDGTFDPATDEEGIYTYTVTSENGCSASATVTIVIGTQEPNCPEVTETEQTFCGDAPTVADLAPAGVLWYSSADGMDALDATAVLVDGTVYFAGPIEGTCDDRPSVTVTVSDNPAAPTVTDFNDCVVTGATVADLDITGEDGATFSVYSDEALETPAADTDELVEGTYYITQTNAAGCESEAAAITVTLDDATAPTLTTGGDVFCEFDGATIAELQENVTATGNITWYTTATGTQTVPQNTVLQNNTTYYAAATDATTGCESSQRLAVTVTLEVCEIMIPEAFSPNGDGMNDRFVVMNLSSEYPNHNMEIYNRWGEPVYKGQAGESQGWDGTSTEGSFGSGVLPAGVYFYILYFNDGQTAPTQGRVYLSR